MSDLTTHVNQEGSDYLEITLAARNVKLSKFRGCEHIERRLKSQAWEAPLPTILPAAVARTKGIFVDVGGSYGIYTILAGLARRDVEIHTFEPFREAGDLLRQHVALNGIQERVAIHDIALSDRAGHAKLYLPDPSHGLLETSASLEATFKKEHAGYQQVEMRTLDSYDFDQPISVIKIDIEGHEYAVFRGARRVLAEDRPIFFAEMLPPAKSHFFEISKLMHDHAYVNFRMWTTCLIETPVVTFDPMSWNYAFIPQEMMPTIRLICLAHGLEILTEY